MSLEFGVVHELRTKNIIKKVLLRDNLSLFLIIDLFQYFLKSFYHVISQFQDIFSIIQHKVDMLPEHLGEFQSIKEFYS